MDLLVQHIAHLNSPGTQPPVPNSGFAKIEFDVVGRTGGSITVTDDNAHYFEISELANDVIALLDKRWNLNESRVKLHRWSFIVEPDNGPRSWTLDLTCKNLE